MEIIKMGIFDRFKRNPVKKNIGNSQMGATRNPESSKTVSGSRHITDSVPTYQPRLLQMVDVNNANHRFNQIRGNPAAFKHTTELSRKVLGKRPRPFMYVRDIFAKELKPFISMDALHKKWAEVGMFDHLQQAFALGLGVNSAFIVQTSPGIFTIFNTSHIEKYWRDPITRIIHEVKLRWPASKGGILGKRGKEVSNVKEGEMIYVYGKIGIDTVMLTPVPDSEDPFGFALTTPLWQMLISKIINKHYHMILNKKGGIASRVLIIPDSVEDAWLRRFEKEAKKGIESELIEMIYPRALATKQNDPSKYTQWKENPAGRVDFTGLDKLLSQDSNLPPSFMDGPATGSLGGVNASEDSDEIKEIASHYFSMVIKGIKDINEVFFNYHGKYDIVPYMEPEDEKTKIGKDGKPVDDKEDGEEKKEGEENEDKEEPETKKNKLEIKSHNAYFKKDITKKNKLEIKSHNAYFKKDITKKNSVADNNHTVYRGNLLESGDYEFGYWFSEIQYIPPEEIQKFVDDPYSEKKGYVYLESHPDYDNKFQAIGNYEIEGWKVNEKGNVEDITKLTLKYDPGVDVLKVSPMITAPAKFEEKTGKITQRDITIIHCTITQFPRSELTGQKTEVKKVAD